MTCDDCGADRVITVQLVQVIAEGTKLERRVHWKCCVKCWKGRQK